MKPGGKPAARPRPMGGFNPGMGAGSNEHLDEAAMQAAVGQKQLKQQQSSTQAGSGKSGSNPLPAQQSDASDALGEGKPDVAPPKKSRPVADLKTELIDRPLDDIKSELGGFFDLNKLFGVNTDDTPEEAARKQQLHQRWQKLDQEQQQVAKQKFEEEMQRKQAAEEEEQQKKEAEAAEEQQAIAPPSAPKKGPIGPGAGQSKKQKAQTQLQQSRQSLGKVGGKN